jgi:hypothetical protein
VPDLSIPLSTTIINGTNGLRMRLNGYLLVNLDVTGWIDKFLGIIHVMLDMEILREYGKF